MRITIVSISCCNPAMKPEEQAYLTKVKEALGQSKVNAQVLIVPISEAMSSLGADTVRSLWPLWEKYGAAIVPAMFIDDELVLYGGVPSKERIIEALAKYGGGSQRIEVKPAGNEVAQSENERRK
jgi:hypothetical protein